MTPEFNYSSVSIVNVRYQIAYRERYSKNIEANLEMMVMLSAISIKVER